MPEEPMLFQDNQKSLTVLKDIGCGVHMQAEIPDTSRLFISIGLGFYPEVTLQEASSICSDEVQLLQHQLDQQQKEVANIEAHIELIKDGLMGLEQLATADP